MDCFHDFCLACDRESTSGPYCSQACRLADLEKATSSTPTSPAMATFPSSDRQPPTSSSAQGSGYFLPQAYRFPDPTITPSQSSINSHRQSQPSQRSPKQATRQGTIDIQRSLTPSSSRTSLSSNHSNSNSMSEQAKHELQEYFSAFHATKSSKRRQSTW